jgi:hypothetical protein
VKDMLGNELRVGDCVMVKYGNEWLSGMLAQLKDGGIAIGLGNPTAKNNQAQVTADVVVVQLTVPLAGPPGQNQPFIARLDIKNQVDAVIESSVKM